MIVNFELLLLFLTAIFVLWKLSRLEAAIARMNRDVRSDVATVRIDLIDVIKNTSFNMSDSEWKGVVQRASKDLSYLKTLRPSLETSRQIEFAEETIEAYGGKCVNIPNTLGEIRDELAALIRAK